MIRLPNVSVRELAAMIFAQGDLYPVTQGVGVDAETGIRVQQIVQKQRKRAQDDYQAEVNLSCQWQLDDTDCKLSGRADGVLHDAAGSLVEEFKCSDVLPSEPDPVDLGQVLIYGGLVAQEYLDHEPARSITVTLTYVQAEDLSEVQFSEQYTTEQLIEVLRWISLLFAVRWRRHVERLNQRMGYCQDLEFPFTEYRTGQLAIARRVYRALQENDQLLLEAPTGSGKSVAVLYPALKGLRSTQQIFFATSKNSGAEAALSALSLMQDERQRVACVEITAKEKICPVEGMPCRADRCQYAAGYFDRVRPAVDEVLNVGVADRAQIEQIAETHQVCPFELSLDALNWADVIVGDYNYLFDPVVRLQRLADHKDLQLLVDEAHQLAPRTQAMLATSLSRADSRFKTGLATIDKRLKAVDRQLMALRKTHGEGSHQVEDFQALDRAVERFLSTVNELEVDLAAEPQFAQVYFNCHKWLRAQSWQSEGFAALLTVAGREVTAENVCLDPAPYLTSVFAQHGASVRFSATITPLELFQTLHGAADAPSERAPNPFASEQSAVFLVPDIATYYKSRQASLPKLTQLIRNVCCTKPGKYLVAAPSYAYLSAIAGALEADVRLFKQVQGMDKTELDELLESFAGSEEGLLCVVMGGSLSESVDFADTQLNGVIVVGLGLPPPELKRDLQQAYFEARDQIGQHVAYTQPAMSKIQQAAGRLIRSDSDRGVILLVDPRFTQNEIRTFFPAHWQPRIAPSSGIQSALHAFWANTAD